MELDKKNNNKRKIKCIFQCNSCLLFWKSFFNSPKCPQGCKVVGTFISETNVKTPAPKTQHECEKCHFKWKTRLDKTRCPMGCKISEETKKARNSRKTRYQCKSCEFKWKSILLEPNCPQCRTDNVEKITVAPKQKYYCNVCHKTWFSPDLDKSLCPTVSNVVGSEGCNVYGIKIGIGIYNCECGNTFHGYTKMDVPSPCYKCNNMIFPADILPPRRIHSKNRKNKHNCGQCNGSGKCPLKDKAMSREDSKDKSNNHTPGEKRRSRNQRRRERKLKGKTTSVGNNTPGPVAAMLQRLSLNN